MMALLVPLMMMMDNSRLLPFCAASVEYHSAVFDVRRAFSSYRCCANIVHAFSD